MISDQLKTALLTSTLLTCAFAPATFAADDQKALATIVANLMLKDGATIEFQEAASGGIGVAAQTHARSNGNLNLETINGVRIAELARLSPVEVYKKVMGGSAAPAALVAAQQRADAATKRQGAGKVLRLPELPARAHDDGRTRSQAQRCYYNVRGSWDAYFSAYYLKSSIYVYLGRPSIYHYLRVGGIVRVPQWVGAGQLGWIYWYGGSYSKSAHTRDYWGSYYNWCLDWY